MCDGKCNCKSKIEIEEVQTDYGTQLRFAVPESGMNEPSVDVVDELRGEISDFFMGVRKVIVERYGESSEVVVTIHDMYSKEIMEIIDSYRK